MKKLLLVVLLFAAAAFGQSEPKDTVTAEQVQQFREQVQQELGNPVRDLNSRLDALIKKRKSADVESAAVVLMSLPAPAPAPASMSSPK